MAEIECFPMEHGGYPDQANTVGGWLVTSWPGGRVDPIRGGYGTHGGIDLVRNVGTHGAPFYTVVAGRVSQGWDGSGGGNWTSLFGDNGDYFGYGHALDFAPGVNGTHVAAGTLLGWIDSTGGSTGAHMHFAVNFGGSGPYDDPYPLLVNAADRGAYPGAIGRPPTTSGEDIDMTPDELSKMLDEKFKAQNDYIDARLEQVAQADRAHMAAIADQRTAQLEATDGALVKNVERVRDEALAARPV